MNSTDALDYLPLPKPIYLPIDTVVTKELVEKLMEVHKDNLKRYQVLQAYHDGNMAIRGRRKDDDKPNNKLIMEYPSYIVDILVGLFVGKPVTYSMRSEHSDIMERIQDILDSNDEQDENSEIATIASIKGKAYEIVYLDEEGDLQFNEIEPDNIIMVMTDTIKPEPLFALYVREQLTTDTLGNDGEERKHNITAYTDSEIIEYVEEENGFFEVERRGHPFGEVPVIEFLNNDKGKGDFEGVLSLIDAINKAHSDTSNDLEEFTDAFLVLYGMLNMDEKDLETLKKDRVLLIDKSDGALQGAEWLIKQINDTALQNHKNWLDEFIHKFSKVPNMADENFAGNVSGEAMKYKLFGTEQVLARKERKFKKGLQKRLRLILTVEGLLANTEYDYRSITITFGDNKPYNELDEIRMVNESLNAGLSKQYAYSKLRDLDDIQEELERQSQEVTMDPHVQEMMKALDEERTDERDQEEH